MAVSGGSTLPILNGTTIPMPLRQSRPHESAHFRNRISFFIRIRVNSALKRLWRAVSKQYGFGDRIDWFRVNGRPIINIKRVCSFKSIWIRVDEA